MPALTQDQIDAYVAVVQGLQDDYFRINGFTFGLPPLVTTDEGSRYVRIVKNDRDCEGKLRDMGKHVHTFLDRTNGDILKGNWKSPVKNGVRGNVNNPGYEACITQHGTVYLR